MAAAAFEHSGQPVALAAALAAALVASLAASLAAAHAAALAAALVIARVAALAVALALAAHPYVLCSRTSIYMHLRAYGCIRVYKLINL